MTVLYDLGVLGAPTLDQIAELRQAIADLLLPFKLHLGGEVSLTVPPAIFVADEQRGAAAVFFGAPGAVADGASALSRGGTAVIPVASSLDKLAIASEIPTTLRNLNCMGANGGIKPIALALLECAGLLPRQRRVFISYLRNESTEAALQLFSALSARVYEVFLDTHGVLPAEDFQSVLWHRLCDSDVLLMLDTPKYFGSRWTTAEFGRALAKGISIVRIGWPSMTASSRIGMTHPIDLPADDIDPVSGRLTPDAVDRICDKVEVLRGTSHAVRTLNMHSKILQEVQSIGGSIAAVGAKGAVHLVLSDGTKLTAYPTVKAPTSSDLHKADLHAPPGPTAVIYDAVGLHPEWLVHLDWLDKKIARPGWVKIHELGWQLAAWNR